MADFVLGRDSAVFIRTTSGKTIYVTGLKGEHLTRKAFAIARLLEGIESDPGPEAPPALSQVAQCAVGLPAVQEMRAFLQKKD